MAGQENKVSIVLPTRNGARYLRESMASCLNQTHRDIELLVVDDGSTDETPSIIRDFTDPRVVCLTQPQSVGLARALNIGFAAASGSYLTWTSDDNRYVPAAIETMLAVLRQNENVDFVYARYDAIDEHGTVIRPGNVREPAALDYDNCIGGCFLYRRRVYEGTGNFNPAAFLAEDYEYWLRVRREFRMKRIDDALYYFRIHPASLTGRHSEKEVQEQVARVRAPFVSTWKRHYFRGKRCFDGAQFREALWHLLVSSLLNPLHYETWRLLALVILAVSPLTEIAPVKGFVERRRPH